MRKEPWAKSYSVEIVVSLLAQTRDAFKVTNGTEASAVWIPKSQCELTHKAGDVYSMELMIDLAREKRLI